MFRQPHMFERLNVLESFGGHGSKRVKNGLVFKTCLDRLCFDVSTAWSGVEAPSNLGIDSRQCHVVLVWWMNHLGSG